MNAVTFWSTQTTGLNGVTSGADVLSAGGPSRTVRGGIEHHAATLATGLRALQTSGLSVATLETARGALQKMATASALLAGADGLESGLAAVMAEQAKQTDQRLELAKSQALRKFDELKLKNMEERAQIQKRVEAARSSGFWSKLIMFFKAIGAALAAASSIFTGPAGLAASALLVVSMIISAVKPDGWGQWLSLGLSLAAMALGGYAALSNLFGTAAGSAGTAASGVSAATATKTAAETVKSGIKLATQIGSSASQATAGGMTFVKGHFDQEELLGQAALTELRALKRQLLAEVDEEREEIKAIIEAQDRGVKAVVRALESYYGAALAALRRLP